MIWLRRTLGTLTYVWSTRKSLIIKILESFTGMISMLIRVSWWRVPPRTMPTTTLIQYPSSHTEERTRIQVYSFCRSTSSHMKTPILESKSRMTSTILRKWMIYKSSKESPCRRKRRHIKYKNMSLNSQKNNKQWVYTNGESNHRSRQ